jgi:hypothetical protein
MFDKQRSWLKIFLMIIIIGFLLITYVDNVIEINRLVKENYKLKENLNEIKEQNLILMKKLNEMELPERIIEHSKKYLKMKFPEKPPKELLE